MPVMSRSEIEARRAPRAASAPQPAAAPEPAPVPLSAPAPAPTPSAEGLENAVGELTNEVRGVRAALAQQTAATLAVKVMDGTVRRDGKGRIEGFNVTITTKS